MLGKDLLSVADLSADDITRLLDLAVELKAQRRQHGQPLTQQTLALIFQKPSLRTRVSFEVAMRHLVEQAIYISKSEIGLGEA